MRNSNDIFDMLFRMFLKQTFNPDSSGNPKDNRAENQMMLAALGLLAFVGVDALKVVFRKNFGRNGLSLLRVVLSSIAFAIIAYGGYYFSNPEVEINPDFGSHKSYYWVFLFYLFLSLYVLIKGIMHKGKSARQNIHPEYRGDSHLLESLITKSGWSQENIQNWAEPLLTLSLGALLATINLLWGIPIIFCALSVWGNKLIDYLFGIDHVSEKIQKHGYRGSNDDFTQIHS